jgi:hypothetical protein
VDGRPREAEREPSRIRRISRALPIGFAQNERFRAGSRIRRGEFSSTTNVMTFRFAKNVGCSLGCARQNFSGSIGTRYRHQRLSFEEPKAKTRQRRIVTISENLSAWLQPCRKSSGRVAPFLQNPWHRSLESIAESAGLRLFPNVLRHSFGSYHFARHRNENLTAAEMGNSPAMVFQQYRAVVTPEAAARFWSIVPSPKSNMIDFAA